MAYISMVGYDGKIYTTILNDEALSEKAFIEVIKSFTDQVNNRSETIEMKSIKLLEQRRKREKENHILDLWNADGVIQIRRRRGDIAFEEFAMDRV